jgi:hypothetical protein
MRWSRRSFLASGMGLPLSALAAELERISFSDYALEFRADAQNENPRVKAFRPAQTHFSDHSRC